MPVYLLNLKVIYIYKFQLALALPTNKNIKIIKNKNWKCNVYYQFISGLKVLFLIVLFT